MPDEPGVDALSAPAAEAPPAGRAAAPPPVYARRPPWWPRHATLILLILGIGSAVTIAGFVIRLPYYTFEPGDALDLSTRIEVDGAPTYEPDGEVLMLFVTQDSNVNVWEWVRASLDDDIDIEPEADVAGDRSPEEVRIASLFEMERAQISAKRVALETAGYDVPAGEGLEVLGLMPDQPASRVLETGDVVLSADGQALAETTALGEVIQTHEPGETVELAIRRGDEALTLDVEVGLDEPSGRRVIGVYVAGRYDFPIDIEIDTARVGGPSAGLAMTLEIIDELTRGDLTGGKRVAVTGTIEEDGTVGEIGAISQKAVAARAADAELFLVPACRNPDSRPSCEADLRKARDRAGSVPVVPVGTLDEALAALDEAGGDPLPDGLRARTDGNRD